MYQALDKRFYHAIEDWGLDKHTQIIVNGRVTTLKNFVHVISFVCAKLLQPMCPLVTHLQGKLGEVYFGFKTVEEIHIYEKNT